jgi:hypothetical protein
VKKKKKEEEEEASTRSGFDVVGRCLFSRRFTETESGTEVKFLGRVNAETRAMIKRSSREGDLRKKFKFEEMSSISTLDKSRGRINRRGRVTGTNANETSPGKLLKRIYSSCLSGYEKRKSVRGIKRRVPWPQNKVIWKW